MNTQRKHDTSVCVIIELILWDAFDSLHFLFKSAELWINFDMIFYISLDVNETTKCRLFFK